MLSVEGTILLCGFPHKNPHKFHNHEGWDLCVMEIFSRQKKTYEKSGKMASENSLPLKTISMAISLMIKTQKWWFANFAILKYRKKLKSAISPRKVCQ
jgi:hypothetical protein